MKNENDTRSEELVDGLQNMVREIRWHKRTSKGVNSQLSHTTAASGPTHPLFVTLPRQSPKTTEIAEEKEHSSTAQLEALEAIVRSTAKSAEALSLLVEIAEQIKERSKHGKGSDDAKAEDEESDSTDSEEEDSSTSLSSSTDDESSSAAKNHYLSLLSERHDRTNSPLISMNDRDELLALAAARDRKIGGLLQQKYFVAKARHDKERSKRTLDTRVEKRKKKTRH